MYHRDWRWKGLTFRHDETMREAGRGRKTKRQTRVRRYRSSNPEAFVLFPKPTMTLASCFRYSSGRSLVEAARGKRWSIRISRIPILRMTTCDRRPASFLLLALVYTHPILWHRCHSRPNFLDEFASLRELSRCEFVENDIERFRFFDFRLRVFDDQRSVWKETVFEIVSIPSFCWSNPEQTVESRRNRKREDWIVRKRPKHMLSSSVCETDRYRAPERRDNRLHFQLLDSSKCDPSPIPSNLQFRNNLRVDTWREENRAWHHARLLVQRGDGSVSGTRFEGSEKWMMFRVLLFCEDRGRLDERQDSRKEERWRERAESDGVPASHDRWCS